MLRRVRSVERKEGRRVEGLTDLARAVGIDEEIVADGEGVEGVVLHSRKENDASDDGRESADRGDSGGKAIHLQRGVRGAQLGNEVGELGVSSDPLVGLVVGRDERGHVGGDDFVQSRGVRGVIEIGNVENSTGSEVLCDTFLGPVVGICQVGEEFVANRGARDSQKRIESATIREKTGETILDDPVVLGAGGHQQGVERMLRSQTLLSSLANVTHNKVNIDKMN
jgi:hypothetical protein